MFKIDRETREYIYCFCPNPVHKQEHPHERDRRASLCITKNGEYAGCYHCFSCGKNGTLSDEEVKEYIGTPGKHKSRRKRNWNKIQGKFLEYGKQETFSKEFRAYGVGTYKDWITFPILNSVEKIIGIQKRRGKEKRFMEGTEMGLFIPNLKWKNCKTLYICEGVSDGISVLKLGLFSLARVQWGSQYTRINKWIEERGLESARKIVVADENEVGIAGATELWENLDNSTIKIAPKKDIRYSIKKYGPDKMKKWLVKK